MKFNIPFLMTDFGVCFLPIYLCILVFLLLLPTGYWGYTGMDDGVSGPAKCDPGYLKYHLFKGIFLSPER